MTHYYIESVVRFMLLCFAKGLSTAKGGRGHVTKYMYCVTIKIQMLEPDNILKIVHKAYVRVLYHDARARSAVVDACGNLYPVLHYIDTV